MEKPGAIIEEWTERSPFPAPNRVFRIDRGPAVLVHCEYGDEPKKPGTPVTMEVDNIWYFAWRIRFLKWEWKGYFGPKPIDLTDPKFRVPEALRAVYADKNPRELSVRPGSTKSMQEWR